MTPVTPERPDNALYRIWEREAREGATARKDRRRAKRKGTGGSLGVFKGHHPYKRPVLARS